MCQSEKNKIAIKVFGMKNAQGISTIPEIVEIREVSKRNTKTVSELILGSDFNTRDGVKPSPFTKVHQEGEAMVFEGMIAEDMDRTVTDLGKKFNEWLEEKSICFGSAKEWRRLTVKIMGTNVDHYQEMTL